MDTEQITKLLETMAEKAREASPDLQPFKLYDHVIWHDPEDHEFWGNYELVHDGVKVGRIQLVLAYHIK